MGDVVYIGKGRALRIEDDPWRIVGAHVVPYGTEWGVAYRCANGKSIAHHVGTHEQAEKALRPVGSSLPAPPAAELKRSGEDRLSVVLRDLYASGIHTQIASAEAKGWIVRIGDREHGCVAERVFANDHLDRATDWLIREAIRAYPGSAFSQRYTGFAAS
jgi:hypothetical protein